LLDAIYKPEKDLIKRREYLREENQMFEKCVESSRNRCPHPGFTGWSMSICIAALLCLLLSAPGVLAQTPVDFFCTFGGPSACTGTVARSGSNVSSTGISVFNDSGPYLSTVPFTLAFNTLTGSVSVDGTGIYLGEDLVGHITTSMVAGKSFTMIMFVSDWTSLPPLVQTQLGSTIGTGGGFVFALASGRPFSIDAAALPTPEPTSFFLCLGGIVLVGIKALRPR
jgi:hypothetical protein